MDGGIIGILVIVFVVVGIISSAAQSSKKKQQQQSGAQPPRPTMSDIQRAFMMMTGLEEEKEQQPQKQPQRVQSYAPPPPSPGAYSSAPLEGSSDFGAARSGSLDYTPLSRSGSLDYTPLSREGGSGVYTFASESVTEAEQTVTELKESEGAVYGADLSASDGRAKHHKAPALKLFEHQGDYVRAVIYSEILSRRQRGRRA